MDFQPYNIIRLTEEPNMVISTSEMKLYLKVDHSDDDVIIEQMIRAAQELTEDYCWTAWNSVSFSLQVPSWNGGKIYFPRSAPSMAFNGDPNTQVYFDKDGNSQTISNTKRIIKGTFPYVQIEGDLPELYERDDAITLTLIVAWNFIPKSVLQAIYLIVADMYENRVDHALAKYTLPKASEAILNMYRQWRY